MPLHNGRLTIAVAMRGPHPSDAELFAAAVLPALREAAGDLGYLLSRGYGRPGALQLVGDRYQLAARQRQVLGRAVHADRIAEVIRRSAGASVRRCHLCIDGYNVLITTETALAGGLLVLGDDGYLRDAREAHGAYHVHAGTETALMHVAATLTDLQPASTTVFLDRPMHHSGQLAGRLRAAGLTAEVVDSADAALRALGREPETVVATSDAGVLSHGCPATDLPAHVIAHAGWAAWIIDLAPNAMAATQRLILVDDKATRERQ